MAGCCAQEKNFDGASQTYKRILLVIIAINGVMFGQLPSAAGRCVGFSGGYGELCGQSVGDRQSTQRT